MLRRRPLSPRAVAVALAGALVAGNALVRGGVDLPALAASAVVAALALAAAPRARVGRPVAIPALVLGLAAATAAIALQLLPLPPALLRALAPATAAILEGSLAPAGLFPSWRPLSLDRAATALELAKAATFAAAAAAAAVLGASERRRDQLLAAIALSGAAVTAVHYGAALLGLSPLLAPKVTFVNTNHLAGFLLLASFPSLGFALRARGPARAAWLAAFAFTASGVFLSLSRAGAAAFFVGAGIFAVLRLRAAPFDSAGASRPRRAGRTGETRPLDSESASRPRRAGRTRGRVVAAGGLAGALAIASWLALEPIVAELASVGDEATTAAKLGLWPAAVAIARDFPLAGIGRGAFATAFPAYKTEPLQRTFTHVENEWLQLPAELGLLAGAGLVALFAWAFFAAARRRPLSRPLCGALAGAGALAAQSLFDFGLELPGVALPFAMVLGLASRAMPRLEVRAGAVRALAALALAVAAGGLLAHRSLAARADPAALSAAADADGAIRAARAALEVRPADYLPPATVGLRLAAEDRCAEALPWLERAMLRNPTAPEPHRGAAFCLAEAGDDAGAWREYRLAFLLGDAGALADAHLRYPAPGALLAIAPETPEGLLAAGELLRERPAEAAEAWRRAWETFGDTRALAKLAEARLALGAPEEALGLARTLQARAPALGAGWTLAARALDALSRRDEAVAELERGAARLPGDPAVLAALGQRHLAARRFSAAKGAFDAIVAREGPALARKRLLVARALEGQGRLQEALREAQVAREIEPESAPALEAFSRLAAAVGRYDEAIEALELAARLPAARPGGYGERLAALRAAREEQRTRRLVNGMGAP